MTTATELEGSAPERQVDRSQAPARVAFVAAMCVLDPRSGAARSVRRQLETLAAAGWEAVSITASLCDGADEVSPFRLLGPEGGKPEHVGKNLVIKDSGVRHHVFRTASTAGPNFQLAEGQHLLALVDHLLREHPPDVVITYGGSTFSRKLQSIIRRRTRRMVFYLANDTYDDATLFRAMDAVVCPSAFLRDHYRQRLGLEPEILPNLIDESEYVDPPASAAECEARRTLGCVTMINPSLEKGATLFLRLTQMALQRRPEWTFFALEGRLSAAEWRQAGLDVDALANVLWLPNQADMRRIYARTSVLLFPSFWQEASGRSIAEALLSGIPVLASDRGGIPEQMNAGGRSLPVPASCLDNYGRVPAATEIEPWLATLAEWLGSAEAYAAACRRARAAAEPHQPERTRRITVDFYTRLCC